ncbi:hypothetical protein NSMS1_61450 (plasmid) [Nostoc sp. MS1]|nr:hypothetical protein NSMS1_61450 [Nostoc sp. MS1]
MPAAGYAIALDFSLKQRLQKAMHRGKPIFLYHYGGRIMPPSQSYYWRMMNEHPSMKIYQLEVRN